METREDKFRNIWDRTLDEAINQASNATSKFKIEPVSPQEFFELWLKEPLFPEQYRIVNQVFTKDYKDWRTDIKEILLLWGEGGSKDFTTVRTLVYCCYWLCCLRNPQEYFHIGLNTPLVVACMSVNEEHAKEVFFKQFTTCLRSVRDPATGKNFFEDLGVDLREGKDIQTRKVLLPNHIEAYALDAARYSGEGKNILMAIFDEIAEVRYDRAKTRYDNIRNTAHSRFHDHYKIVMISYPRDQYDFMMSHYNEIEEWPDVDKNQVFKSRKAPWEVRCNSKDTHPFLIQKRLYKLKEDYTPLYRKNPEDAARRYECKFPKSTANRYLKKFDLILDRCVKFDRPSPFISDNQVFLTEKDLMDVIWQPWFRCNYSYEAYLLEQKLLKNPNDADLQKALSIELEKHECAQYFIHIDLSRGVKDCAGFALIHPYQLTPTQIGYYIDLAVQIRPEENEINFEDIRKFIFKLDSKGFDISRSTLDGFQSIDFTQILERKGIQSGIVSVDRSRKPYDTVKSLMYQGKVNIYNYLVLLRELKELIIDVKGKVEHPKESVQRLKEEGLKAGSKDVSDSITGAIFSAVEQESDIGPAVIDPSDSELPF